MGNPALADLAVILAAGGGSRIGTPKGLLERGGAPLVRSHVDALRPFARRVIVVIGARAEAHRAVLADVDLVENPDWAAEWPADSLARALRDVPPPEVVLVTPVDTPPAAPDTLRALLAAGAPCVPVGPDGRPGHPVVLDARLAAAIAAHPPEGGLRVALVGAARVPVVQPDVAVDFDTPEAWSAHLAGGGG